MAKPGEKRTPILRRYTDLTATIDLLTRKCLTLLDPASWDDRNDSYFLQYYKEHSANRMVLALCLSTIGETYHHWRVFCGHPSGVCVEFRRKELLAVIKGMQGVRHGAVDYLTLGKMAETAPDLKKLPFIKRHAFRHELEYRLIYEAADRSEPTHSLPIPMSVIAGITLSPWMPPPLLESTRDALHAIPGCEKLKITRSELISNQQWQRNAGRALRGEPLIATPQQIAEN